MTSSKYNNNGIKNFITYGLVLSTGLILGQVTQNGWAGRAAPTEHNGVSVESLGVVTEASLSKQIGLDGYIMQLREISLMPGGAIKKHSHEGRPGLVWTVSGSWVEGRPSGEIEYPAGKMEAIVEDENTEHWFFNDGTEPAKVVVCDVVPAA